MEIMFFVCLISQYLLLFLLKQTSSMLVNEGKSWTTEGLLFHQNQHLAGHRLVRGIFQTIRVRSSIECLFQCTNNPYCSSVNYKKTSENTTTNCEFVQEGSKQEYMKDALYSHYAIIPQPYNFCDSSPCPKHTACDEKSRKCLCLLEYARFDCENVLAQSCYDILLQGKNTGSGYYWIQPNLEKHPIYIYCDMETEDGGWTLVYSYNFTNYSNFYTQSNAVIPRPSWPAREADVPISTNLPVNGKGAVDFSLWQFIGENFLVKSNINDWIVCYPIKGSLVVPANGSIFCRNLKNLTAACSGVAPTKIFWKPSGPKVHRLNTIYRFDGSTSDSYPTHNPCDKSWRDNQKKNVEDAGGSIYLRGEMVPRNDMGESSGQGSGQGSGSDAN